MTQSEDRDPQERTVREEDVHASDIERRAFLRFGVFAATGLAGLMVGCGGDNGSDSADSDSGDPADADPTDPADADTGDPADSD
jgi:hypothetical protein